MTKFQIQNNMKNPTNQTEAILYHLQNMGSITSSNFKLIPGETYKVSFGMISDTPFFYTPEAELPRARIINNTLGKYISGGSITSSVAEFKNTEMWKSIANNWVGEGDTLDQILADMIENYGETIKGLIVP